MKNSIKKIPNDLPQQAERDVSKTRKPKGIKLSPTDKNKKLSQFNQLRKEYGFNLIPLVGKDPIDKAWQKYSINDCEFVASDFTNYNAGVVCGPASGVIVLDVDDAHSFEILVKSNNLDLPKTLTIRTGGGGKHYYYKYPKNNNKYRSRSTNHPIFKEITMFDIRGSGGQVVAPGSTHPVTGKLYKVINDAEIAKAPSWLRKYSRTRKGIDDSCLFETPLPESQSSKFIKSLKISPKIKKHILAEQVKGERSEIIMRVIISLLRAKFSDKIIHYIFQFYSIGQKFRDDKNCDLKWLDAEISSAKAFVKKKYNNDAVVEVDEEALGKKADEILEEQRPEDFDHTYLPQVLREYVDYVHETTDAATIMITMAAIASVSGFLKNDIYLPETEYFQALYPNLYMLSICGSGEYKTTALNKGGKIAFRKQKKIQESMLELRRTLNFAKKHKGTDDADSGLDKAEIEEKISELEKQDLVLPDRSTPEALLQHLANGAGGVLFLSEFGQWLESMGKSHNSGMKGMFTDLYDVPQQYRYKTKNSGDFILARPFITIAGVSTMPWVDNNLNRDDVSSGFFARFLLFYPPKRERITPPALPKRIKTNSSAEKELENLLTKIPPKWRYRLSTPTRKLFNELHHKLHSDFQGLPERSREILGPFVQRWSPYLLKLGMIFQFCNDPDSVRIKPEALTAASSVVNYAMQSTKILFHKELGESQVQRNCRRVLEYIAKRGGKIRRHQLQSSHILEGGTAAYDYILSTLADEKKIDIDSSPTKKRDYLYVLVV